MAIELYWDNDEQNIMLCVFEKNWTWEQMFETFDTVKKVTDRLNYEVGAIIDVTSGMRIPGGSIFSATARDNALKMLRMSDNNKGPIAIVGAGGAVKSLTKAFSMVDRKALNDVYFADTLEQARQILNQRLMEPQSAAS